MRITLLARGGEQEPAAVPQPLPLQGGGWEGVSPCAIFVESQKLVPLRAPAFMPGGRADIRSPHMTGGLYPLFFRKRMDPKYFGREIGSLPPAENWLHGASCVVGGLILLMWTDSFAYGAMAWGVLQLVHGIVQRVLGGGRKEGEAGV